MARMMYKERLGKGMLVLLRGWKRDDLTDTKITHNMGTSISTLNKRKRERVQAGQALKRGRDEINTIAENALLKEALSSNTTAMIFLPKNNWRDKYNDSQLSKEERELVLVNIKKANADARVKEAKAIMTERLGTEGSRQLDQILNKLIEETGKVSTDKSINEETD